MSTYAMKISDTINVNWMTPESATIISAGTVTMPNALNDDDTYGYDVDLPGTDAIPVSKIGVIILPAQTNIHYEARAQWWQTDSGGDIYYSPTACLRGNGSYSFYTKNPTTGVMTAYTPGNFTTFDASEWDGLVSVFPIVGWDRTAASITSVRLWAATCYIILSGDDILQAVYSIGNTGGITSVDYAIFLKEWNY